MTLKVLAAGTVMIDILAVELERIADPGEVTYVTRAVEARIGGHPIDVAIDLVKLGANPDEVGVVAAVGTGLFGDYARKTVGQYGLAAFFQDIGDVDTGKNIVLEKTGEDRRFHIDPGANWYLSAGFVRDMVRDLSPQVFCVRPGYCGIDLELEEIFREVKDKDCLLFLDMMQFHPARPAGLLLPLFQYADLVHCNRKEAMVNTGRDTPEAAVREILDRGAGVVFLTRGGEGAEVFADRWHLSQPGFRTDFVDATGAGDAFCAGVVRTLLGTQATRDVRGLQCDALAELLMAGQAVGAAATTAAGCVEGVSADTVDGLVREQGERVLAGTTVEATRRA